MILLFWEGGGTASETPTTFPLDVGYATGLQPTDAIFHHRAPHRRAMWTDVGHRIALKHADALQRLADG